MNRVTIELWLGLGKELKGDFEPLSEVRSRREEEVEAGTTLGQLLDHLARSSISFARNVFDREAKSLRSHLVVNYNGRILSPYQVDNQILENGDKLIILPMYAGG